MRKFLVAVIAVAALGAGSAFAQSGYWAGLSTGYPFGLTAHFGLEDLFSPGLDLRMNLRGEGFGGSAGGVAYSGIAVGLGADLLYNLEDLSTDPSLNPYVGGGLTLGFASGATATGIGIGGFVYDIHGLAGAEYLVAPAWGIFGEAQIGFASTAVAVALPGGGFATGSQSGISFGLKLGVNYHF